MTARKPLATALWSARFASGLLQPSYTTYRDTTQNGAFRRVVAMEACGSAHHWGRAIEALGMKSG